MMRHSILYLLLPFLYEMMHHDFSLQNYKLSNDLSSNVVIHECVLFLTLTIFLKKIKILLYFLYVAFPPRIRILAFQKSGGSVSVSKNFYMMPKVNLCLGHFWPPKHAPELYHYFPI
jgi:hypothetical protein